MLSAPQMERNNSRHLLMCLANLHLHLVLLPQDRLVDLRRPCQVPLAAPLYICRLKSQAKWESGSNLECFLHPCHLQSHLLALKT